MDERILIVDDEEDIRVVLRISLSDLGYEVYTAENGEKALQIIREVNPPIVLTDIRMPVMDGIDLLRRVKHEYPETEVIMITGHGDMDLAIESLKHKATDFITKPIKDEVLEIAGGGDVHDWLGSAGVGDVHDLQAGLAIGHVGVVSMDGEASGKPRRVVGADLAEGLADGDIALGGQLVEFLFVRARLPGEGCVPGGLEVLALCNGASATGRVEAILGDVEVLGHRGVLVIQADRLARQAHPWGQGIGVAPPYALAGVFEVAAHIPAAQVNLV